MLAKYIRLQDDRIIILSKSLLHATRAKRDEVKSAGMLLWDGGQLVTMGDSQSLGVDRLPDDVEVLRRFFEQ